MLNTEATREHYLSSKISQVNLWLREYRCLDTRVWVCMCEVLSITCLCVPLVRLTGFHILCYGEIEPLWGYKNHVYKFNFYP